MNGPKSSRETKPARVAVIIVNYKSAALTLDALRSLESEWLSPRLELSAIVVENNSGDGPALRAGLSGMRGVELIEAPRNGGFAYGNNLALRHLLAREPKPDYFLLLNPDTRPAPGAVTHLVRFLAEHPQAGIAGSSLQNADGSEWPFAFRFPSLFGEIEQGLRWGVASKLLSRWVVARRMGAAPELVDWLPGAALMLKRELVETVGGMDERYFLYYEETDYCMKARRAGFTCWYVPQSRVMHISGQSTGVTGRARPRRFPGYWFESRRRYFTKNHGVAYAAFSDVAFVASAGLGWLKDRVQGREDETALFAYDVLRYSPLFEHNRYCAPEQGFAPEPAAPVPVTAAATANR
jgi:N-acetylglucosaminyl-diphospho-decaprenol L-rhamnosyltransferase